MQVRKYIRSALLRLCCWLPVLDADDRQTHLAFLVNVRMVDFRQECDCRRLERVLGRKVKLDFVRALVVRLTILQFRGV